MWGFLTNNSYRAASFRPTPLKSIPFWRNDQLNMFFPDLLNEVANAPSN